MLSFPYADAYASQTDHIPRLYHNRIAGVLQNPVQRIRCRLSAENRGVRTGFRVQKLRRLHQMIQMPVRDKHRPILPKIVDAVWILASCQLDEGIK